MFVVFCLVLWAISAAYVAKVEEPLVARLRHLTEDWGAAARGPGGEPVLDLPPPLPRLPWSSAQRAGYGAVGRGEV